MISIKVPPLGESIVEATVSRWLKNEGEAVAQGDTLVELETDKITVEVPAFKAGVLARQLRKEGDVVKVDEELGELDDAATGAATAEQPSQAAAPAQPAAAQAAPSAPAANAPAASRGAAVAQPAASAAGAQKTAPSARRLAAEENVDIANVQGSGRGGVVTKEDVMHAAASPATGTAQSAAAPAPHAPSQPAAPAPSAPRAPAAPRPAWGNGDGTRETREKMTTRRRRIAEHLLESQQSTAHLTTFNEVDMSAVMALRERMKAKVEKEHGVKLTYMPFFARAAIMALQSYPTVNAQIEGDSILYKHYVNLGIAVASDQGLVVPVIKDAERKGMLEFSRELTEIAQRSRAGKLTMDDLTGGTFTITNGGVFGSLVSTPILNYPQVGILGLHKIQDRPMAVDGKVEIRPMMYIALSYDHRLVEGQTAVLFLVRIKELMEDPAAMLID
ncbi:MAG TPA: 2-oxoglutarate dehydrogenase complex dihydrolipoyllysine-residue succinyltransferase [Gemmatimonadaceae bacterium]|nr:2-oxoglutarate dehydrogenase complex dihydrolipoyllysine-residue succinyltransferase [Gemmatimonadaceae bacterium]